MTKNAGSLLLILGGLLTGHLIGVLTPPQHLEAVGVVALCVGCFFLGMQVENIRVRMALRSIDSSAKPK